MTIRVAVLTVSDGVSHGSREDRSGDVLTAWVSDRGFAIADRQVVPDETDCIARQLIEWADQDVADVIVTTGGTGLGPRDVTPEATRAVIDREAPGIAEAIRADARGHTPRSVLSRGLAGTRGSAIIVNLPGSAGGVKDGIGTLDPLVEHVVQLLRNEPTDHT